MVDAPPGNCKRLLFKAKTEQKTPKPNILKTDLDSIDEKEVNSPKTLNSVQKVHILADNNHILNPKFCLSIA